ncbi:hypothetical protein Bca52824_007524 [Brassica carinata]|uniref:MATH domain-containing protein n=1 Tax=Brassica carinata TaxID=52824 RepID=A0A8X7W7N1_BRACI|nr:hypothetical protein Bca52824_007524 [Brassica carinata]
MGQQQMEKKFTWVSPNISYCLGNTCYSPPYSVAGCDWYLSACPKGDYLCLYLELEPESLPPGWTRDVKFSLTLVTKAFSKSNILMQTQRCFSEEIEGWGCDKFVSLAKLRERSEGFLVNNKIIILAELHVLPPAVVVVPQETVKKITEPLSIQADDASVGKSQRDSSYQVKSLEDASQTSVSETDNSLITKIQPTKETIAISGFDVYSSQVESVSYIFKRHPDIALNFRPKNQQIRRAYMNELLNIIEVLCQSPEKLSEDDLSNANDTLADLIDVGFKLDWLKIKLDVVSEKKKKEKGSEARLRTMEEQLQKLKLMLLDLETQLQMEKAEALAARAPLSFNDIVC